VKRLLNISTHENDMQVIDHDWSYARRFLEENQFDGYELYPVPGYSFEKIPPELILGLHMSFFVIYEPLWHEKRDRLLEIFGDEATIKHFYGGLERDDLIATYQEQLRMADRFGCEYVVFHVSQCELEYIFDWQIPWSWQETVDLFAEMANAFTEGTPYKGKLLFENLWWPGSLRLDSPAEIERLMQKVTYPNAGIVLDTGHILNKNQSIHSEAEGIAYLLETVKNLGSLRSLIYGVHLTRSLSADYVNGTRHVQDPYRDAKTFWDRFIIAHKHVCQIDQHDPFEDPGIVQLFDLIDPNFLVFEFGYPTLAVWQDKINRQKQALGHRFWPSDGNRAE